MAVASSPLTLPRVSRAGSYVGWTASERPRTRFYQFHEGTGDARCGVWTLSLTERPAATRRSIAAQRQDTIRVRVADIPGLIDGAHRNRGLGHEFLRHVSRTRGLMFVVDAAGSEGRDPVEDLMSLKEELRLYDGDLAGKPAFVVANKIDLQGEGETNVEECGRRWRLVRF